MPSPIIKGQQSIVLISEEPVFNAETGLLEVERTWEGAKVAVFSFAEQLAQDHFTYRISNNGALSRVTARIPQVDTTQLADQDRWEISTESVDKSIFEHESVIVQASSYDTTISDGAPTFKKAVEDAAEAQADFPGTGTDPNQVFAACVRHLRAGVTGYQRDFLLIRRFRKIDLTYGYSGGRFNLGDDALIYTTGQLQLPANVAFAIPATPTDPSSDFSWGWKRRGQRVEIVGTTVEQTVELLFAPWSTLLYIRSGANLDW